MNKFVDAIKNADATAAAGVFAENAVTFGKLGTVMKHTGHTQILDAIFALFQKGQLLVACGFIIIYIVTFQKKGGLFDPATNPQWKLEKIVKLADNSVMFLMSGEFQSFNIPYHVGNFVFNDKCEVIVESAFGLITPIEK